MYAFTRDLASVNDELELIFYVGMYKKMNKLSININMIFNWNWIPSNCHNTQLPLAFDRLGSGEVYRVQQLPKIHYVLEE